MNMQERFRVTPSAEASASSGESIDLRQMQDFVWRRWRFILGVTASVMALTFLIMLALTPRYTATAEVLLDPHKETIFASQAQSVAPESNMESAKVDSQISVITSINLLRWVVEKEKLTDDAEFGAQPPSLLAWLLFQFQRLFSSHETPPDDGDTNAAQEFIPEDVLGSIIRLYNALSASRVKNTYVIDIAVTSKSPVKAARLANAIANAYLVDQLEARYDSVKRASAWFAERMQGLRDQVRQSEEAVAKFRRDNNLIAASSEGKATISEQQLSELSAKLIGARAEAAEKRAKYTQAQEIQKKGGNIQAIPDVVRSPVISALRAQQAEVARKEADLVARYSEQHPLVVNARAERRDIERSIAAEVARVISNLKNDYDVAKTGEDSLQDSLTRATGAASGLDNNVGVRLRELERVNVANKTLFEDFLSRAKLTQEQSSFEEREARLISPATSPSTPSYPKKMLVEALASVVGLMVGVGGGIVLEMLNPGFTAAREVEEKLGLPVLASVSLLSEADRKLRGQIVDPSHYLLAKPLSRYAESIRALRVGLKMADVDHSIKSILVTSSGSDEGKTTMAISLAFSAHKAGQKALLLDGDLRHPGLSKFFGLENKPGLVDHLAGTVALEDAIVTVGGIAVLSAGSKSMHPADLLGSDRMKRLIAQLQDVYDYVIVDSPPAAAVIDARVLAELVDKVLFVIRWGGADRDLVAQTLRHFMSDKKLAGLVLNLVDESRIPRYGPYSHHSSESYRKYYQG